jgi:hypothetical protein
MMGDLFVSDALDVAGWCEVFEHDWQTCLPWTWCIRCWGVLEDAEGLPVAILGMPKSHNLSRTKEVE